MLKCTNTPTKIVYAYDSNRGDPPRPTQSSPDTMGTMYAELVTQLSAQRPGSLATQSLPKRISLVQFNLSLYRSFRIVPLQREVVWRGAFAQTYIASTNPCYCSYLLLSYCFGNRE